MGVDKSARNHAAKALRRRKVVIQAALAIGLTAYEWGRLHYSSEPYHTSALTGQMWVDELLDGHRKRIRRILGVHKHVFRKLASELQRLAGLSNTKHVRIEESIAIYLWTCRTNNSYRQVCERFQRSSDTISQ